MNAVAAELGNGKWKPPRRPNERGRCRARQREVETCRVLLRNMEMQLETLPGGTASGRLTTRRSMWNLTLGRERSSSPISNPAS
jgi:hypothetical protein